MAKTPNDPKLVKGTIALLIAAGCLGLLVFLLTPVGPQRQGTAQPSSDVIVVKPPLVEGPLVRA